MSRAKTAEEVRADFLAHVRFLARYWSEQKGSPLERCNGVAFSILAALDGCCEIVPAMKLICDPHPLDMSFDLERGDNWVESGTDITDGVMLHDLFYGPANMTNGIAPDAGRG